MKISTENKWYVIRAVSGQESKIKDYIMSEIKRLGFSNNVEDIIVPKEKVIQIRNGKKISKEKVYFPGYIMSKANLSGEVPHIIKSVTNVIGFLGETKGGDPIPMRPIEVNRMLGKVDELSLETEHIAIPFNIGDNVIIAAGAVVVDNIPSNSIAAGLKICSTKITTSKTLTIVSLLKSPITLSVAS